MYLCYLYYVPRFYTWDAMISLPSFVEWKLDMWYESKLICFVKSGFFIYKICLWQRCTTYPQQYIGLFLCSLARHLQIQSFYSFPLSYITLENMRYITFVQPATPMECKTALRVHLYLSSPLSMPALFCIACICADALDTVYILVQVGWICVPFQEIN